METDNLPDDVLLGILNYLDTRSVLAASMVCTSWWRVTRDSSLWTCLDLAPYHRSLDEPTILRILSTYFVPLGKRLSLNKCIVTSEILRLFVTQCPKLHTLSLLDCKFPSIGTLDDWEEMRNLKVLDLRCACGYSAELQHILTWSSQLECLGLHSCVGPRLSFNAINNKARLRVLDCSNSEWVDDITIQTVAKNCPLLESLSVAGCTNVQGNSLQILLMSCLNLTTIVLAGTRLRDRAAVDTDWQLSIINELDVMNCHQLSSSGLSAMLLHLSHLRYLKCALTDENLKVLQPRGHHQKLEVLQLHRRYPITLQYVSQWLSTCPQMRCLDISSIPLNSDHFERFLSKMPLLLTLNFAGYKVLGLEDIIYSLAKHCLNLETISINFYHSSNNKQVKQAFVVLIQRCRRLRTIILGGLYVTDLVAELCSLARFSCLRDDVEIRENEHFVLPYPCLCVENMVRVADCLR